MQKKVIKMCFPLFLKILVMFYRRDMTIAVDCDVKHQTKQKTILKMVCDSICVIKTCLTSLYKAISVTRVNGTSCTKLVIKILGYWTQMMCNSNIPKSQLFIDPVTTPV